jgi:hypothetical protein
MTFVAKQTEIISEELSKECKAMICVILLLRLKKFLKYFYGLSDKYMEYYKKKSPLPNSNTNPLLITITSKIQQFLPQDTKLCPLNNKVPIETADFKTLLSIEIIKEGNWEHNNDLCQQVFDIVRSNQRRKSNISISTSFDLILGKF